MLVDDWSRGRNSTDPLYSILEDVDDLMMELRLIHEPKETGRFSVKYSAWG